MKMVMIQTQTQTLFRFSFVTGFFSIPYFNANSPLYAEQIFFSPSSIQNDFGSTISWRSIVLLFRFGNNTSNKWYIYFFGEYCHSAICTHLLLLKYFIDGFWSHFRCVYWILSNSFFVCSRYCCTIRMCTVFSVVIPVAFMVDDDFVPF